MANCSAISPRNSSFPTAILMAISQTVAALAFEGS
jgi:hypothetical protein